MTMTEDDLNAHLMLELMKILSPRVYVAIRKHLVEHGLEDPFLINALIAEMNYVQDEVGAATLVVNETNPDSVTAHVADGALVDRILSDDGGSEM